MEDFSYLPKIAQNNPKIFSGGKKFAHHQHQQKKRRHRSCSARMTVTESFSYILIIFNLPARKAAFKKAFSEKPV
jgi:hypothetical protein